MVGANMFAKSMLILCFVLAACGSSRTTILDDLNTPHAISSYKLVESRSTTDAPQEAKQLFHKDIVTGLSERGYTRGDDLTIEYRFIQFNAGNRFTRWMWGGLGNAGEGEITAEVLFKDHCGKTLSKIHVGGRIDSGFFGGSFECAIRNAAQEVVTYVEKAFPKS
jgi:hypothetical protein